MRTTKSASFAKLGASFVVLSLMLGALSLLFLMEWRTARIQQASVSNELKQSFGRLQKQMEAQKDQLRAVLDHFVNTRVGQSERFRESRTWETTPEDDLPILPEHLDCEGLVRSKDLPALFLEPTLNPQGKDYHRDVVDVVSGTRLQAELEQAKAKLRILDSRILVRMTESMDQLRSEGKFVEYEDGEPFQGMGGVLTSAEHREGGGSRLFYYHPVDFPDIYDMQEQRKEVAERALRRIAAILSDTLPGANEDAEG